MSGMYENIQLREPRWKSWIVETTSPLFSPEQCKQIIDCGKRQKPHNALIGNGPYDEGKLDTKQRITTVSWIPFKEMPQMYRDLYDFIQKTNQNHFGFDDIQITEHAQFTEYPEGGFYDWHMDCDISMEHEPPVRKISMTLLLNDPAEFEGGDLELMAPGKFKPMNQGHATIFASFINHRVNPIRRGVRQSLVVWFGGKPFR